MSAPKPSRVTPLGAVALVLAVAIAWLAAEAAVAVLTIPGVSRPELGARLIELAPWHLLLFAGGALPIAWLVRSQRPSPTAVAWLAIAYGSFAFLGARVAESLMRTSGAPAAAVGMIAVALCVAIAIAAVAAAARFAPAPLRSGVAFGAQVAWTLGFALVLDRIGPEIGDGQLDPARWPSLFASTEIARVAVLAIGLTLAVTRLPAVVRAAGLALAIAPFALVARAPAPVDPAATPDGVARPEVVVLVLDTMRGDHLGRRDERGSLTPALDALAADAVRFENAFAPSNWTRGSMPGVLASLPLAVTGNAPAASDDLLAEHLQRAGYRGYGISANPLVSARLGWAQGFDHFVDPDTMGDFLVSQILQGAGGVLPALGYRIGAVTNSSYFRAATELRRRAARALEEAPRPTFLFVQAMDPHGPYLPPHSALPPDFAYGDVFSYYRFMQLRGQNVLGSEAFRPELENFRERYAASVRYLDGEVGAILDTLRAQGRYDEALIWVLADHGEAFGEHDWAGHTGFELGPALVRVPLIAKLPKSWGVAPRVEPTAVSTYSLVPTTLALLGLPPAKVAFGADLSGLVRGSAPPPSTIFIDTSDGKRALYAAIRWPWKLESLYEPTPAVRGLYDLAADPAEEHSLADQHPEIVAALGADIEDFRARVEKARGAGSNADVDAATREMLRRLGYAE